MAGQKPELKISIKPPERGAQRLDLIAYWRNDNGMLSGKLDRRIKGMRIYLEDGTRVDLKRTSDGKHSHFINAYEERGGSAPRDNFGGGSSGSDDFPPDDFGDDPDSSIPF